MKISKEIHFFLMLDNISLTINAKKILFISVFLPFWTLRCYTIEEYAERRVQIIEELKNYKKETEIIDIASDIFMTK